MSCASHSERAACDTALVARQPIFDREMRVTGYELLYRSAAEDERARVGDPRQATLQVIASASLEIGLDVLVGAVPAFINVPQELLVFDAPPPLPPRRIFIEVLECVRAEPEVIRCLSTLRRRGYRVALDDFSFAHGDAGLLDVADVVKIDMTTQRDDDLENTVAALRTRGIPLIAEKVETRQRFEHCVRLGFSGFQGHFLRRPETFEARRVPASRLSALRILAELQNPELDIVDLELLIARDLGISYRLLRCINSGFYSLPRTVRTLHQALVVFGLDNLRRLCTPVALAGFDDRPVQLLADSMVRARMCEPLARTAGVREAGPYFVTGMFSLLDVLLGRPLPEALDLLPLAPPIRRARASIKGQSGPRRSTPAEAARHPARVRRGAQRDQPTLLREARLRCSALSAVRSTRSTALATAWSKQSWNRRRSWSLCGSGLGPHAVRAAALMRR